MNHLFVNQIDVLRLSFVVHRGTQKRDLKRKFSNILPNTGSSETGLLLLVICLSFFENSTNI